MGGCYSTPDPQLIAEIVACIRETGIVDMHVHFTYQSLDKPQFDLFELFTRGYGAKGLTNQGFSPDHFATLDTEARWQYIQPYLKNIEATRHYRMLICAFRELFDFDGLALEDHNWRAIAEKIESHREDAAWHRSVAGPRSSNRYIFSVTTVFELQGPPFALVPFVNGYLYALRRGTLDKWEAEFGISLRSADGQIEGCRRFFDKLDRLGAIGVQANHSYSRAMRVSNPSPQEAEVALTRAPGEATEGELQALEDFLMRQILSLCTEFDMPIQFHTGPVSDTRDGNPVDLVPLFQEFPQTRFILNHSGYPFISQTALLPRFHENVFVDFCWLPVLSKAATLQFLIEFIELNPAGRTMWGADTKDAISGLGHNIVAVNDTAEALAILVAEGALCTETAMHYARSIMHDGALAVHKMSNQPKFEANWRSHTK